MLSKLEALKRQGNEQFKEQNHAAAITHYDAALALARDAGQGHHEALEAVLLANRAACLLALKEWQAAEADATQAVRLDPSFAKGYMHTARAQLQLHAENGEELETFEEEDLPDLEVCGSVKDLDVYTPSEKYSP